MYFVFVLVIRGNVLRNIMILLFQAMRMLVHISMVHIGLGWSNTLKLLHLIKRW